MARCHIDVGIQWSVPGGGGHWLCRGNRVSAVVVDVGALSPVWGAEFVANGRVCFLISYVLC